MNTEKTQPASLEHVVSTRRSYVGEIELAVEKAMSSNHDRNPNRYAEVQGWLEYGFAVAIARRGREPIPPRPSKAFV